VFVTAPREEPVTPPCEGVGAGCIFASTGAKNKEVNPPKINFKLRRRLKKFELTTTSCSSDLEITTAQAPSQPAPKAPAKNQVALAGTTARLGTRRPFTGKSPHVIATLRNENPNRSPESRRQMSCGSAGRNHKIELRDGGGRVLPAFQIIREIHHMGHAPRFFRTDITLKTDELDGKAAQPEKLLGGKSALEFVFKVRISLPAKADAKTLLFAQSIPPLFNEDRMRSQIGSAKKIRLGEQQEERSILTGNPEVPFAIFHFVATDDSSHADHPRKERRQTRMTTDVDGHPSFREEPGEADGDDLIAETSLANEENLFSARIPAGPARKAGVEPP
jgi:hypothetical protein